VAAICSKDSSPRRTSGHLWKQCVVAIQQDRLARLDKPLRPIEFARFFFWDLRIDERLADSLSTNVMEATDGSLPSGSVI